MTPDFDMLAIDEGLDEDFELDLEDAMLPRQIAADVNFAVMSALVVGALLLLMRRPAAVGRFRRLHREPRPGEHPVPVPDHAELAEVEADEDTHDVELDQLGGLGVEGDDQHDRRHHGERTDPAREGSVSMRLVGCV